MIIRKQFNVESAHIVRNCTSERCSHSIHGHSAIIEVFLEASILDNAQMVYDFGLMKGTIKQFIDAMDHCYLLCGKDNEDFKNFIKTSCDRWIELPFNPSAEMLSLFIYQGVKKILENTITSNNEGKVSVKAVRYHETATGYAECNYNDFINFDCNYKLTDVVFSKGVLKDFSQNLIDIIFNNKKVYNPIVNQQINLK